MIRLREDSAAGEAAARARPSIQHRVGACAGQNEGYREIHRDGKDMTGTDAGQREHRGALRVYLGAAPGVGKTYAMLEEARRQVQRGADVVVGVAETYGRADTAALLDGLELVPPARLHYRGGTFDELDLDAVLARRPQIAVVDELAHTNVPGCRNGKRWRDVEELLQAGIDVYSTVNVQHLESLNDVVERITGIQQQETVPDAVVRAADQIDLVDITPEELRTRLAEGKVYEPDRIDTAMTNYFREGNLTALRELALLWLADQVDIALDKYRVDERITDIWETRERVAVAVTGGPESDKLIHRAARIASRTSARLMVVHVVTGDGLVGASAKAMAEIRRTAEGLQASVHSIVGDDVAAALLDFARSVDATQLVLGSSHRSRLSRLLDAGIGERVIRESGQIDVHIVTHARSAPSGPPGVPDERSRAVLGWVAAVVLPAAIAVGVLVPGNRLGVGAVGALCFLAALAAAALGGVAPAALCLLASGALLIGAVLTAGETPPSTTGDIATIVVLLTAAAVVAVVVDAALTRGRVARRATREAELLTLFAGSVLHGADLPALLERVRETYGQRGVSLLQRDRGPVCAVGEHPPATTAAASTVCEVGDGEYALTLSGRRLAAHDLRVLTAIAIQSVALYRQRQLDEEAREARVLAAADLVDSSRLATDEARPRLDRVPVAAAVDRAMRIQSIDTDTVRADIGAATVRADPGLLDRVLGILLANALRHSAGRPVRIAAARVGEQCVITVADAGTGIPPGEATAVFDPFRRLDTDRDTTGFGLELALWAARGFVEAMGGSVTATATPGAGLTVIVTLAAER